MSYIGNAPTQQVCNKRKAPWLPAKFTTNLSFQNGKQLRREQNLSWNPSSSPVGKKIFLVQLNKNINKKVSSMSGTQKFKSIVLTI